MKTKRTYSKTIAGQVYNATYSDLADQAGQSVILSSQGTVVLATVCMGNDSSKNPGYFNLTVEYSEKFYASGDIIGVRYQRREGRPSQTATLASRIIDRTLRPLFDQRIKDSVQIITTVLALGDADPIIIATNAASLALHTSPAPWNGPIGCVRIGSTKSAPDTIVINPFFENNLIDNVSHIDLLVCGNDRGVNMIECGAYEIPDETFDTLLEQSYAIVREFTAWQHELAQTESKEKRVYEFGELDEKLVKLFHDTMPAYISEHLFGEDSKKRIGHIMDHWSELVDTYIDEHPDETFENKNLADDYCDHYIDEVLHTAAIEQGKRADGRALDEIRPLYAQAGGVAERLHGTGIFYRGGTHVLSITTLSGPDSNLLHEGMETKGEQRFFHQYNFPPYSVGETGRIGNTNRREIGHGALVEKALVPVIPDILDFPYTIRVVSECVASNGSTSQASVCASTLALMDTGVPITRPVAGISIGLMMSDNKHALLTDIQGPEDHHGDMDFKVAGTEHGITAIQMDIKLDAVPVAVLQEAVKRAHTARLQILEVIKQEIPAPRPELSPYAPRIEILMIDPEKIGMVIGSGGKTIQKIQKDTGTDINIEDDGQVIITGEVTGVTKAREIIENMLHEWSVGEKITGQIVKIIEETGAIVEFGYGSSGMIHISEISKDRVESVSDKLQTGQTVEAVIVSVDPERDRIGLSIKKLNDDPSTFNDRPKRQDRPHQGASRDSGRPRNTSTGF